MGSASEVHACIRFDRRSGSCLLEGKGRPPSCVPVRRPIAVGETKRDTGYISQESFEWRLDSWPLPRNKIRRCSRGNPRKQCRLRLSRTPYPRSPCYSNLSSISDRQLPQIDGVTHSGSRCTASHHRLKEIPWSCSELGIAGTV